MTDYRDEFLKLADRLEQIEAKNDEDGCRYVERLAAQAAHLLAESEANGLFKVPIGGQWTPVVRFGDDTEKLWCVSWVIACRVLAAKHPGKLPESIGWPRPKMKSVGDGVRVGQTRVWLHDWRERAADYASVCRLVGELVEPAASSKPATENDDLDARALAIFVVHNDWSKRDIAKEIGCHEKSLSPGRCPRLASAIRAFKAPQLARGSKSATGDLEAWEED